MGTLLHVEFVAGPWCGRTESIDRRHGPAPPLSLTLDRDRADGPLPVYRRRGPGPDPNTGRWMFDHVPKKA